MKQRKKMNQELKRTSKSTRRKARYEDPDLLLFLYMLPYTNAYSTFPTEFDRKQ